MRFLTRAVFLLVAAVLMLFSVSNRETVSVALWPLPFVADLPLYLLCFASLLVGALIGLGASWVAAGRDRRELRALRRRIQALERELAATQSQLDNDRSMRTELPASRQLRQFAGEERAGPQQLV